jgi:hypothetical protein
VRQAFLRYVTPLRASVVSVVVASDQRLSHAAKAESPEVLDPEMVPAADIPDFLAAL